MSDRQSSGPTRSAATPPTRSPRRGSGRRGSGRTLALAAIGVVVAGIAAAFAWTAGWLDGDRLTAAGLIDAMEEADSSQPGFRQTHAKGVCLAGSFVGSSAAPALSSARIFAGDVIPAMGRFSIGGADPYGADSTARVRSLALQLGGPSEPQWRMAMNNFPFFAVSSVEGFQQQLQAKRPDPTTGKPDAAAVAAFEASHPEVLDFQQWAKTAPWTDSWANTQYNSVNAFRFTNADRETQVVRWSMRPQAPVVEMDAAQRNAASANYLATELQTRLDDGPLHWDMVVTLAEQGDPVTDPSQQWPSERKQVVVGTLTVTQIAPQSTGACRDVNFDPLILPPGVAGSDDPILAARSAVYAKSFNRRERDIALGHADAATGEEPSP